MKKISVVILIAIAMSTSVNAQLGGLLDKAKSTASAAGIDVNQLTSDIMGKLTPSLNLTAAQTPKVTDAITGFLAEKSKILPLQGTDKAAYTSKFGSLFSGLKSKLTGILLKDQMNKFLGMKTTDPTNVLSQLFH
jgi:hypothetical protein